MNNQPKIRPVRRTSILGLPLYREVTLRGPIWPRGKARALPPRCFGDVGGDGEGAGVELGTAVLETYPYHPLLQANRAASVVDADWTAHTDGRSVPPSHPVSVLVSALGPRLLRVAGAVADGTVLWMAPAKAIESHVVPTIAAAAAAAGRPAPRIVAGRPKFIRLEEGVGLSSTHDEVVQSFETYLAVVEPKSERAVNGP